MIERPYFVYVAFTPQDTAERRQVTGVSHHPLLDLKLLSTLGYNKLAVTAGPMPLARAMHEVETLKRKMHRPVHRKAFITRAFRRLSQALRHRRKIAYFDIVTARDVQNVVLPDDTDLIAVAETLRGRILFNREIRKALSERGHHITDALHDILQTLVLKGVIGRVPSVATDRFGIASCKRCGNRDVVYASCSSCSSNECYYCPECASMGQAKACRPLYYAPRDTFSLLNEPANDPTKLSGERVRLPGEPLRFLNDSTQVCSGNSVNIGIQVRPEISENFIVKLNFELTKAQKHASQLIVDFLKSSTHNECLVFAVCGAGKTEVVFQAIAHVLRRGGKVLFAIPRSDVVAEVAPRIAAAIPAARILELRGKTKLRYLDADIVIATTHQTLRFFQAFDLVILDEVDAFPYRGNSYLHYAVRRATAPWGKTVFMTATPDRAMLRKARQNRIATVRISARHHGRPLPEPEIVRVRLPLPDKTGRSVWGSSNSHSRVPQSHNSAGGISGNELRLPGNEVSLPDKVIAIIERSLGAGRKMFVFVPTVKLSRLICLGLSTSLHDFRQLPGNSKGTFWTPLKDSSQLKNLHQPRKPRIASIHAAHPNRESHRESFRDGNIDIIVSTSILERGITVANADVLVLYADYEQIFDTATLTQMAGRAGRTSDDTEAKVYFVAERITTSMRTAIRLIQDMNRHAAESKYLQTSDAFEPSCDLKL